MDTREEQTLVDLHIKVAREYGEAFRGFVNNESCRSQREVMVYFLEVMLAVLKSNPGLQLSAKPYKDDRLVRDIRARVPSALFGSLDSAAQNFGMQVSEITRTLMYTALAFHQQLVEQGQVVSKEEFIDRIKKAAAEDRETKVS